MQTSEKPLTIAGETYDFAALAPNGSPTEAFWELWGENKDEMKAQGVRVAKQDGTYTATLADPKKLKPTQGDRLRALAPLPSLADFLAVPKGSRAAFFAALEPALRKAVGLDYVPEQKHPACRRVCLLKGCDVTWLELPPGAPVPEIPIDPSTPASLADMHGKVHDYEAHSTGDHFTLKGISALALKKAFSFSNRLSKEIEGCLTNLRNYQAGKQDSSIVSDRWSEWLALPLNEVKAHIVDKGRAALARHFSPEESAKRREQAEKNEELSAWVREGCKPSGAPLFVNLP